MFIDDIAARSVPGPSTRLDITGVQFSAPAPSAPPVTVGPHLLVIVRCAPGESPDAVLEVTFWRDADRSDGGEQIARNVQPLNIEPGKFAYRLIRAELEFVDFGTVVARCSLDRGPSVDVPYTLLPPVGLPSAGPAAE